RSLCKRIILLPLYALRGAERHDLARIMAGPLVGVSVIAHAQIVDLALLRQTKRVLHVRCGEGIQCPHLILLAPDPAIPLARLPSLASLRAALCVEIPRYPEQASYGHTDQNISCLHISLFSSQKVLGRFGIDIHDTRVNLLRRKRTWRAVRVQR